MSRPKPDTAIGPGQWNRLPNSNYKGFLNDANSFGYQLPAKEDVASFANPSQPSRVLDPRLDVTERSMGPIATLKELCAVEGFAIAFQTQPQFPANPGQRAEVFAQVEIDGQVMGKGRGPTWDDAKAQASESALVALGSVLGNYPNKRQISPRSWQGSQTKEQTRSIQEFYKGCHLQQDMVPMYHERPRHLSDVVQHANRLDPCCCALTANRRGHIVFTKHQEVQSRHMIG